MSAGAFSNDVVVRAANRLTRVLAHKSRAPFLFEKFGVKTTPTTLFLDLEGKESGSIGDGKELHTVVKAINEFADKTNRAPKWDKTKDEAIEFAKGETKPLVVYFTDEKEKAVASEKLFSDKAVADYLDLCRWVKIKLDLKSDEAKKLAITKLPELWIVDPRKDDPFAAPLKKVPMPTKSAAALKAEFEPVLKDWK